MSHRPSPFSYPPQSRPPPPPTRANQVDDRGYQLALPSAHGGTGHTSSSVYDDPVEGELEDYLREQEQGEGGGGWWEGEEGSGGYDYSRFSSSPSPSPKSVSSNRPPTSTASAWYPSQPSTSTSYSRTQSYYAAPALPQPDLSAARQSGPSQSQSATHLTDLPPIRPMPIRPMSIRPMPIRPMPTNRAPPPTWPRPMQTQRQSAFPLPSNGNTARRQDDHLYPDLQKSESRFQPGMDGDYGGSKAVEEEDEYWQDGGEDDGFEDALFEMGIEVQAQGGKGGMQQSRPAYAPPRSHAQARAGLARPPPQQPEVQYYDDLDPRTARSVRQGPGLGPASQGGGGEGGERTIQKAGIKLRPVSELPDMFRSLWRFGVFNAVQSVCFDALFKTDQNVVVSAPTGGGKTVLFELAIIRLFTTSPSTSSKVLYMAPTKSLCAERAADWKKKFEVGLGWTVRELTGDSETGAGTWKEVAKARIIVTTPEKWDAMTRKWHDHDATLGQLRLFCVDEVHSVGADVRGAVLEVVVSRMKTLGTSTRFIAASATVPNIEDVAEWLRNDDEGEKQPAKVFRFGDEFRPCKLQKVVVGYPKNGNDFAFANSLNFRLFELIKQYSSGKPVLIFCNTRKGCLQAAEALAKEYQASLSSSASSRSGLAWPKPPRSGYTTSDKHLAVLLESGIATHHAGMESNDRRLVERLFVEGQISIVCSTSTLAMGVNLPARMVIIRGTKGFNEGRSAEYTEMEIVQMLGRAGRPQFDTMGVACIMTEKESQHRYETLNKLESWRVNLHKNLTEHINSEITLRTITNVASALHWLRSTFLFVRIAKNAPYYGIANGASSSPDARLEEICVEAIKELVGDGIVDEEGESLSPNEYGDIMSKYYVSHPTFVSLKTMQPKATMRTLLEALANATELNSFRFRQGEKSVLGKYNKNLRFPTEKVSTTADRVMIIIQLVLEGIPGQELKTDNINPLLDAPPIWTSALRIVKCMADLAIAREDGALRTILELLRSLNGRCWDGTSFVLRQLDGIGEKSYKALVDAGIKSFADVYEAEADRLELILNRKPPYGHKLIKQARAFPQFEVDLQIEEEGVEGDGVRVNLSVEVRMQTTKPPPVVKKGPIRLFASVLLYTSDGHFIEFRRCRLDQLLTSPKQFSLSVLLVKPSQRVVASVSCDMLAGSEVRAVVKSTTKASHFPIPSLGPEPDDPDDFDMTETPNSSRSKPKVPQRLAERPDDDEAEVGVVGVDQARKRADGKFECNHACGDKTKCKHLCCREGLDKAPRTKAKSVAKGGGSALDVGTSKKRKLSGPLDRLPSTSAGDPPKKRLQPAPSTGVTLRRGADGKMTTTSKVASDDDLPSLDSIVAASKTKAKKVVAPPRRTLSTSNRLASPGPSAPSAKSYRSEIDLFNNDDKDELISSPSPPPTVSRPSVGKRLLLGNRAGQGDETGSKPRRVSLRVFASSSPVELDELHRAVPRPDASAQARKDAEPKKRSDTPVFRALSDDDMTVDADMYSGAVHDGFPQLSSPSMQDEEKDSNAVTEQVEAAQDEPGHQLEEEDQLEEEQQLEEHQLEEHVEPAEEDDFDAWLEGNVLIV
ncbi:hypothetical protein JCM5296_002752 [Sporobolomyces johnsonii]